MVPIDLEPYVENIQRRLVIAAEAAGDDARALAERLLPPLDAAIRLAFQDALVAAAEQITCELAPGSVEVRLRGRDPEFVVTAPVEVVDELPVDDRESAGRPVTPSGSPDADDGAVSRINLRMPDQLKARVEQAAGGEGLSVNSWLVRAATAALDRSAALPRREAHGQKGVQRYTGWAR